MTRWTVRSVPPDAIRVIQDLAASTGTSLGQALSVAVAKGAAAALEELQLQTFDYEMLKDLERVVELQASIFKTLIHLNGQNAAPQR